MAGPCQQLGTFSAANCLLLLGQVCWQYCKQHPVCFTVVLQAILTRVRGAYNGIFLSIFQAASGRERTAWMAAASVALTRMAVVPLSMMAVVACSTTDRPFTLAPVSDTVQYLRPTSRHTCPVLEPHFEAYLLLVVVVNSLWI